MSIPAAGLPDACQFTHSILVSRSGKVGGGKHGGPESVIRLKSRPSEQRPLHQAYVTMRSWNSTREAAIGSFWRKVVDRRSGSFTILPWHRFYRRLSPRSRSYGRAVCLWGV